MANFFSRLFGGRKKRDTTPNIGEPTLPGQTQAGRTALDILSSRAKGQGTAFSPEQINEMFGLGTAQRRFQREQLPFIESRLGRANISSTPQGVGIAARQQASALDRARDVLANRQFQNLQLQQGGIQNALGGLQGLTGSELSQRNLGLQLKQADFQRQLDERNAIEDANQLALGRGLQTGGSALQLLLRILRGNK